MQSREKSVRFFTIRIIFCLIPFKSPPRPPVDPILVSAANKPTARTPAMEDEHNLQTKG